MKRLAALALLLTLSSAHAAISPLAQSGDVELNAADIREAVSPLTAEQRAVLQKDPAAMSQYVRAILVQRLVLKRAAAESWEKKPAVVAELARAREAALAESYLDNVAAVDASYPSAGELVAAYEKAKPRLEVPRSFRLAQIYISGDKSKLDGIAKKLDAKGADFAEIAIGFSEESTSSARGGEIGWLTEEQIQPELRERISTLKLGAISKPIQLKDGWHILKVLDIREAHTPTLDQVRVELAARMRDERAKQNRRDFLDKIARENPVAINEIELSKLPLSNESAGN